MRRTSRGLALDGPMLLAVVAVALLAGAATAGKLYPRCGGTIIERALSPGDEQVMRTVDRRHSRLDVECLAVELQPDPNTRCTKEDEAGFRLYILATWDDDASGLERTTQWDVADTIGGSVQRLRFSVPQKAKFDLIAANKGTRCRFTARALFEYSLVSQTSEQKSNLLPALTGMFPITAYADRRSTDTYWKFKILGGPGAHDVVTVVPLSMPCSVSGRFGQAATRTSKMEYTRVSGRVVDDPEHHSFWRFKFSGPGSLRICYQYKDLKSEMVASVTAFGGNPGFFAIIDGAGPRGEVFLNVPTVARFYGDALDTRPDGDQAKFVNENTPCNSGEPAGGVAVATDLGPSDAFGEGSSTADWQFVLREGGVYRVCYKRKGHDWIEVVNVDDLPGDALHSTPQPIAGDLPPPTHAVTHRECPTAPPRPNQPEADTFLRLYINGHKLPATFREDLAQTMCVPTAVVDIVGVARTATQVIVTVDFACHGVATNYMCSSRERKNMLLYRFHKLRDVDLVKELAIDDVREVKVEGIMGLNDDAYTEEVEKKQRSQVDGSLLTTLIVCGTIAGVCATAVYVFRKYRESHNQFIQFGLDDDDDDDGAFEDGTRGDPAVLPPLPTKNANSAPAAVAVAPARRHVAGDADAGAELH